MIKILNLKFAIMQKFKNLKTLLKEVVNQVGPKRFLWIKMLEIFYHDAWNKRL